jgi:hypothetical protein
VNILTFAKTILNPTKLERDLKANASFGTLYNFMSIKGSDVDLHFKQNLNQSQIDACSVLMNSYSDFSVFDNLKAYLAKNIDPFVANLLEDMRAENMEMGISQANKTTEVVGFFEERILLPNRSRAISLKATLDTSSLTSTLELVTYYINNPNLYSDLAPFITPERLTIWKNKIIAHLSS